ncbi:class I SAM-dependent methyltransferase [Ammonicoccus fulvus]|uniref:Class I SAM-dependent methyltransferase n=1 Tax=Ammonicoccus fulvus TaxID=3138240 RepID=A0ABZ3FQC4_9ACTN
MSEQEWDERYAESDRVWSGQPNAALLTEVEGLTSGTALDVGCGEGADSVWLAERGWQVTGLDISGVALDRAKAGAADRGVDVTWVKSGLLEAGLEDGSFDLVSVFYPPMSRTPDHRVENALADLVAPGGTLLVVHHAPPEPGEEHHHHHDHSGGPDFSTMVSPDSVREALHAREDVWLIHTDDQRERAVSAGRGAHHIRDLVIRAERRI